MQTIDNLHLVNYKNIVFKVDNVLIPEPDYDIETVKRISEFKIYTEGTKLITFIISNYSNVNLLIVQGVFEDDILKYKVVFPREISFYANQFISFINKYLLYSFDVLNPPGTDLIDISDRKEDSIINLFDNYNNINIDNLFMESLLEIPININSIIPNIYVVKFVGFPTQSTNPDNITSSSEQSIPMSSTPEFIEEKSLFSDSDKDTLSQDIEPMEIPMIDNIEHESPQNIRKSYNSNNPVVLTSNTKVVSNIGPITGNATEILGKGTYGSVYQTTKGLAVKTYKEKYIKHSTLIETSILIYLNHPNIIDLIAIQLPKVRMVMSIADTNLKQYNITDIYERKLIFYQIFRGVEYCHHMNIWHRDIKPENILLTNINPTFHGIYNIITVKIADFGISVINPRQELTNETTTIYWRAPEVCLNMTDPIPHEFLKEHRFDINRYLKIISGEEKQSDNSHGIMNFFQKYNSPGITSNFVRYTGLIDEWSIGTMLLEKISNKNIFAGTDNLEHLYDIFNVLGFPSKKDWFLGRIFIEYLYRNRPDIFKQLNKVHNKLDKIYYQQKNTHSSEFEILTSTLTWPTKRKSCTEILKMKYFDDVRDFIEKRIPVTNNNESYIDSLIKQQKQISKKSYIEFDKRRQILFIWLYEVAEDFRLNSRTLFYAYLLFDLVSQYKDIQTNQLQGYIASALKISCDLWEDERLIHINKFVTVTNEAYTEDDFHRIKSDILKIIDFRIIFPTCEDFVYHYTSSHNLDKVKYKKIMYYMLLLQLNYDYATLYTSIQLAQIAIRASNIEITLTNIPNIYTEDIKLYLDNFVPPSELKPYHERYFH